MIEIYILVDGTCKANPGERLTDPEVWSRPTSDGANVIAIGEKHRDRKIIYDSGNFADYKKLVRSLHKMPGYADCVMAGHTHPDHFGLNFHFWEAEWFVPYYDDALESVLSGSGPYARFSHVYKGFKERRITSEKFERLNPDQLPFGWPEQIRVIDTDGHMIGHQSLLIEEPVKIRHLDGEFREYSAKKVVVAGDAVIDSRYMQNFLNGDFENAIYAISFYDGAPLEHIQKRKALDVMGEIVELAGDDGLIIPGHGKPFTLESLQS